MLNIVIPMAGEGQRFQQAGYSMPKPLVEIEGVPMILKVVENLRSNVHHRFIFLCRDEHLRDFQVEQLLRQNEPNCCIVPISKLTQGAACTVLLAADYISNDMPLVIANSDQLIDLHLDDFLCDANERDLDGSILTFPASDPKWSFAKLDINGRVEQVAEKDPISPHATVGVYCYRQGSQFVDAACCMIKKDIRVNNEFYVCPVYNELIHCGARIGIYEIQADQMHGLGTPQDLEQYCARTQTKQPCSMRVP